LINRNTFLKLTTLASLGASIETYGFLNKKKQLSQGINSWGFHFHWVFSIRKKDTFKQSQY
jgi:hypothetical protein